MTHSITIEVVEGGSFGDRKAICSCGWVWITNSKGGMTNACRAHQNRAMKEGK